MSKKVSYFRVILSIAMLLGFTLTLVGCDRSGYTISQDDAQEIISQMSGVTNEASSEDTKFELYKYDNIVVPIPTEYVDLLVIKEPSDVEVETEIDDTQEEEEVDKAFDVYMHHSKPLVSLYEKESVEQGQLEHPGEDWGDGWLFTLIELDRLGFEYWLCTEPNDSEIIGRNAELDTYYLMERPTDVRFFRSEEVMNELLELVDTDEAIANGDITQEEVDNKRYEILHSWSMLMDWANGVLPNDIVSMNDNIEEYSDEAVRDVDSYTYDSEHKRVVYYADKEHTDIVYIVLSQPKTQGKGGIWCVDRIVNIYSGYPDYRLNFPVANGIEQTADEYYSLVQKSCDNGDSTYKWMLNPMDVAFKFTQGPAWYYGEVLLKELSIVED